MKIASERKLLVSVLVRAMQGVLEERLKEHRRKAAPAAAWITEREESWRLYTYRDILCDIYLPRRYRYIAIYRRYMPNGLQ